jgi:hypothetical protein
MIINKESYTAEMRKLFDRMMDSAVKSASAEYGKDAVLKELTIHTKAGTISINVTKKGE